jgi:hypothetical protein
MRKHILNLRQIGGIEERKSRLNLILSQYSSSQLLAYRDEEANVDVFIIEFDNQEEASQANVLMGLTHLSGTKLASLIIPTYYLH